ncbi:hypothetical protein LZD49_28145 [Dyadobacter sp. CY261]|uniref:hypothetical protein n=1 Tax=Dyadobacter sp. CY261 TaxID=2907203 RepID=UPI001F1F550C|nr:hypothetical protein [Dyadobacter sp. CY261]MCF0074388.1 hypothetical protein [Dyadobacter sp. CY261]
MPARQKPPIPYPKSKAIATLTTAFSAIIYKFPDGRIKEILLVSVGLIAYFTYDSFVIVKRFVLHEVSSWISLSITEKRVGKYVHELEIELRSPNTSSERLCEIKSEIKRYRDQLASQRFESLKG